MISIVRVSTAVCAVTALLGGICCAQTSSAVQQQLSQIDRSFICPEALPSDDARKDALKLFLEEFAAVQPSTTVEEVTRFRVAMLRKHQCRTTLANIGATTAAPVSPSASKNDHWEHAGTISGSQGMVITVDMDSMTSAGPGRMRTWIKYRYNGTGPNNAKESLVYEQLDCARSYHSTISIYSYGTNGQIVYTGSGPAEDEEPIVPESVLAGILPFTCAAHGLSVGR